MANNYGNNEEIELMSVKHGQDTLSLRAIKQKNGKIKFDLRFFWFNEDEDMLKPGPRGIRIQSDAFQKVIERAAKINFGTLNESTFANLKNGNKRSGKKASKKKARKGGPRK